MSEKKSKKAEETPQVIERKFNAGLRKAIKSLPDDAKRRAFSHNAPITVSKEGKIVTIYPDGRTEEIGKVKKVKPTIKIAKTMKLK